MSFNLCRAAGEIHLKAFPGLGTSKVCLPGRVFAKPNPAALWFQYEFLPAETWKALGDDGKRYFKGILQVSPFVPAVQGRADLDKSIDALVAHFGNKRLTLNGLVIDLGDPQPGPLNVETDYISMPLSIPFATR